MEKQINVYIFTAAVAAAVTAAVMCLSFISCADIDDFINMKPLEITENFPENGNIDFSQVRFISVKFSEQMNKLSAESSFSVTADNYDIQGIFLWETSLHLKYIPFDNFSRGMIYEYSISPGAEDIYGNSLTKNFNVKFNTGRNKLHPKILSVYPEINSVITDMNQELIFNFSESISHDSFYSSFSIYPPVKGLYIFENNSKTIIFSPLVSYETGRVYKIILSSDIRDTTGSRMLEEYEYFFSTGKTADAGIERVYVSGKHDLADNTITNLNTGIDKNDIIMLYYSSPLNSELRSKPVKISPGTDYYTSWNSTFTEAAVTFKTDLKYNEIYTLEAGNRKYLFKIDGIKSVPPVITQTVFCNSSENPVFEILRLNSIIIPDSSETAFIDFYFKTSSGSPINTSSFFDSFTLTSGAGNFKIIPLRIYNMEYDSIPLPAPLPHGDDETIIRVMCSITAGDNASTLKIIIRKTLKDLFSNSMLEDYILQINTL